MLIEQSHWDKEGGWSFPRESPVETAQVVLVFGGKAALLHADGLEALRARYPEAMLIGCSTAGEIEGVTVRDDSAVATAVRFERTTLRMARIHLGEVAEDSRAAGSRLADALLDPDLRHVIVLSDGLHVNGSDLVRGLESNLPPWVSVTGGLAADGVDFGETWVIAGNTPATRTVVALGMYGRHILVGHASLGGWDPFGPERIVTRSDGNVLYELDGKSALQLYKTYLGEHAAGLPATGLKFPLAVRRTANDTPVVRTILSVDERVQSMTFAGDIPTGSYARLMKANYDRLVDGAAGAARTCLSTTSFAPELALLISCVGRKIVLQQRVEEEVEAVQDVFGERTVLAGFYSYGEISPFTANARCELHNQTMTVTTFAER